MSWSGGFTEWVVDGTAYLSIVFTWRLVEAHEKALFYKSLGYRVVVGGPALHARPDYMADMAEIEPTYPDAIAYHNPQATMASKGCPVGCWFCIVPKYEGKEFMLLPDFPVRPILCDNNLSALPVEYQEHIITRYRETETPLLDANSGFEPKTFTPDVYERWQVINRGPWRFAYDDEDDEPHVKRVMEMLKDESPSKKRVYVLIGTAPVAETIERISQVIAWGGEPHAQPFIPLNSLDKKPSIRLDWSLGLLRDVARWANRRIWRYGDFSEYRRSLRARPEDRNQLSLL